MKRLSLIMVIAVAGFLSITGCSQKKVAVAPEAVSPMEKEVAKSNSVPPASMTGREMLSEKKLPVAEQSAPKTHGTELGKSFNDIYFDYDKYDIRDDAKPALTEVSSFLSKNREAKVIVEGYCDDRGTNEYNLALGDKRAHAAKEYLVASGIPSGRIEPVSFGEEKPVCKDTTEECRAKNRRDRFVLVEERHR